MRVSILIILLLFYPLASAEYVPDNFLEDVFIVYIKPELQTYNAVTRDRLLYSGSCIVAQPPKSLLADIRALIEEAPYGPFDNSMVRIQIHQIGAGDIFFDSRGGVFLEQEGVSKKLDERSFEKLKSLFDPIDGPDGCRSRHWPRQRGVEAQ